jgi:hypothetical protein
MFTRCEGAEELLGGREGDFFSQKSIDESELQLYEGSD